MRIRPLGCERNQWGVAISLSRAPILGLKGPEDRNEDRNLALLSLLRRGWPHKLRSIIAAPGLPEGLPWFSDGPASDRFP